MRLMYRLLQQACLVAACSLPWIPVTAAEIVASPIADGAIVVISGRIVESDYARFDQVIAPYAKATVALESPGGNLLTALAIGATIRRLGFSTVVTDGEVCASACGLIWLAGSPRFMDRNARIGFHAASSQLGDGTVVTNGRGNALVGAYLTKLGLSYAAVDLLTQASPDDILWLTLAQARATGIAISRLPDSQAENQEAVTDPSAERIARVSERFRHDFITGGISAVISAAQQCYADAADNVAAVQECMLYDVAGYRLDRNFTEMVIHQPELRQPYFLDAAYAPRIAHYAQIGFGGWNEAAVRFLVEPSLTILLDLQSDRLQSVR